VRSLFAALQERAAERPDAIAVVDGDKRVRYSALLSQAPGLAGFLTTHSLAPGERVALLLENSAEYVSAYYGVLAAGGIVVGLNTAAKARELSTWLAHCGASWLITDSRHREYRALREQLADTVRVIDVGQAEGDAVPWSKVCAHQAHADPLSGRGESDAASIIYTSGTTGRPKGVTLSHRNLVANTRSILEYLGLSPDDSVMCVLPFYYSYGNSVLHTHIASGATLVLQNSLAFPHVVLEAMARERVTGLSGVPSTFSVLGNRARFADYDLGSLRYVTQAGGAMAPAALQRLRTELPQARVFVMYGQTEGSARLSYLPPERLDDKLGSVGRGIPGVELSVRRQDGGIAEPGETGEIWARGDNIMLGYWNDEALTREVVVDGWLRTGDLAHADSDGYVYIDGRASDMIKSGANRISPQEIEEVIAEVSGVLEVAVVGVPDDVLGQSIKAVVVTRDDGQVGARDILAHCRANLAAYKLPKKIDFVADLPKTASGKIKRFMLTAH
jgi:acyl-CoA synthetase (AMP-forming)/AMP-acid ligase II